MAELTFFTLLVLLAGAATSTHYHIVPITSTALCTQYPVGTCFTLDELSSQVSETDTGNITISFLPGEHLLTWNMTFNGTDDITLNMELHNLSNGTQPRISCINNTGFLFQDLHTLTIEALEVYGCEKKISGVITILNTEHVLIKKCQFMNNQVTKGYPGKNISGGGAIFLHGNTSALIQNSTFLNNSASCFQCYGGAILVNVSNASIDSCSFEHNRALFGDDVGGGGALAQMYGTLSVTKTNFHRNSALQGGSILVSPFSFLSISSCMFIKNTAKTFGGAIHATIHVSINISSCMLINNTAETYGGAIHVTHYSSLSSSGNVYSGNTARSAGAVITVLTTTSFSGDNFSNNSALHAGAAIHHHFKLAMFISNCIFTDNWSRQEIASVIIITGSQLLNISGEVSFMNNRGSLHIINSNVYFYGNTTFINNTGSDTGGAITSVKSTEIVFLETSRTIITGNIADYGGGMFVDQTKVDVYGPMSIYANKAKVSGGGIRAFLSVLRFRQNTFLQHTNITNNTANSNGGGMHLTASNIIVSGSHIHIYGNTAKQYGGGVFLEQSSIIDIGKWQNECHKNVCFQDIRLEFHNNSALRGGAVYVSDASNAEVLCNGFVTNGQQSKQCFLQTLALWDLTTYQLPPNTINTFFKNNTARETGSDIYGGLLDRCTVSDSAEIQKNNSFNGLQYLNSTASFNWADGHIQHSSDFYDHISSDPVRVCFCENDLIDCNSPHPTVFTKKGRTFTLNIVAVDQVGKPVSATIISSLTSGNGGIGRLKEGQQFREIKSCCTTLEYNVYSNDSMAELQLYADGPCGNQGISKQQTRISFLPCTCPIGFERYPPLIDCFCDCDRRLTSYVSNCSSANHTIQINKNVWIDYINTTNASGFVTPHCPFDYCVGKPVNISLASPGETDQQCAFNRTGRMCGQCEEGLSLVFAGSSCQECSNYYIFLIVPFALAGIALVAFILTLNMSVATGTIHGLILYANMLAANRSVFLPFSTPNFLTAFISWLNLDLGIETCFYNGMSSYGKFLLQLTFPAYVFLIIVAVIVLCNCSQRLADLVGKRNPEATLYTCTSLLLQTYSHHYYSLTVHDHQLP